MKKGFTLIELLAVVVILAIIALIAAPTVLNIIENSSESSVKISLDSLERAVDLYYTEKELNGTFNPITFICKNNKCTNGSGTEILKIDARGIERGIVDIDSDGNPAYSLLINGYKCIGINNERTCELGGESIAKSETGDNSTSTTGIKNRAFNNYRIYGSSAGVGDSTENGYVIPVTVRGNNLIPYPYQNNSLTKNGITYTVNSDGSIHASGTATANATFILYQNTTTLPKNVNIGRDYTLSLAYNKESVDNISVACNYYKMGVTNSYSGWFNATPTRVTTKSSPDDMAGLYCYLVVLKDKTVEGTVYPQLDLGTQATDYEPYAAPTTYNITISSPLKAGDYIDFETQKVVRSNGTTESVELPVIHSLDLETTVLEVNTVNKPTNIEITYIK